MKDGISMVVFENDTEQMAIKKMRENCKLILDRLTSIGCDSWIAGGFVRDLLVGDRPRDVDLFFPSEVEANKLINHLNEGGFQVKYTTKNSISYEVGKMTYDIVTGKYFATPEETVDQFDYTVACGYIRANGTVGLSESMLLDVASKSLRLHRPLSYPSTMRRMAKYVRRGYKPCEETLFNLYRGVVDSAPTKPIEPNIAVPQNVTDYEFWARHID